MMSALAVIAQSVTIASQMLSAPVAQTFPSSWIRSDDYPQDALRNQIVGAVGTSLTVDPNGKIIHCEVEKSSGSVLLDTVTCDLLFRRGNYSGGRDVLGQPSYGVDRGTVVWALLGQTLSYSRSIQMAVEIKKMPKGVSDPALVRVDVFVDTAGRVSACRIPDLEKKNDPAPVDIVRATRALGDTACTVAMKDLKVKAAKDESGNLVESSQNIMVGFTTKLKP